MVSQDIVKHLTAEEITMIYSGDDHDYCEIEHNEFTGRIREITVKSMSWAMGIRIPGVQLVSLWNPVDVGKAMSGASLSTPRDTVQNHLCLLPDQLGIFIRYAQVLALTLVALIVQTIRHNPGATPDSPHEKSEPLLPLSREHRESHTSQTSSIQNADQHLSTRKTGGYGHIPASSRTSSPSNPAYDGHERGHDPWAGDDHGAPRHSTVRMASRTGRAAGRWVYFVTSAVQVVGPVLLVYAWLIWKT